jgi:hypothetical protein
MCRLGSTRRCCAASWSRLTLEQMIFMGDGLCRTALGRGHAPHYAPSCSCRR